MDKETELINRINRNFMDYKAKMLKLDAGLSCLPVYESPSVADELS
ncbi:hypothetical protein Psfp_01513 [Pelotomaculum sp. FP]|nr:hypothetical protein [Pelotomaculum sp. FP]TEB16286.1 hypothetical protein Psfp_01513 [Pelotomaculum sp. FP]